MTSIYAVDIPVARNQRVRYVVIAGSANEAAAQVARAESTRFASFPGETPIDPETYEVGRLGSFDPGNEGAAMTSLSSIVAIQRPAF